VNVLWFIPIGLVVGTYGTIIGAGGGFIIVPLLVLLFPQDGPSMITAASLAVIFVNATSGTIAYARMKRISYRTGILFATATIPGALVGSWLTHFIPRRIFGLIFGSLLVAVAVFLAITRGRGKRAETGKDALKGTVRHISLVDAEGKTHELAYRPVLGVILSLFIGCFSSLVGIGGGLIHVPVLTTLFAFPMHIATATSHFILVFTSLAGVVEHIIDHTWPTHLLRDLCLAVGVVVGAQLGALLSRRISSRWIVVGLAVALGAVGVRLALGALG